MATDTLEAIKLTKDDVFILRLHLLMVAVARTVLAEDSAVGFHNLRARWANRVLNSPDREIVKASFVVAMIPAVTLASTDAVLTAAIAAEVNILAGAFNPSADPADGVPHEVIIERNDHDNDPNTPAIVKRTVRNLFGLLR
jgi:hypothetical protein